MPSHLYDALPIIVELVLCIVAPFPIVTIRIGGRIGDDLRTMLDNRKART